VQNKTRSEKSGQKKGEPVKFAPDLKDVHGITVVSRKIMIVSPNLNRSFVFDDATKLSQLFVIFKNVSNILAKKIFRHVMFDWH
jgi:hypothetical protein